MNIEKKKMSAEGKYWIAFGISIPLFPPVAFIFLLLALYARTKDGIMASGITCASLGFVVAALSAILPKYESDGRSLENVKTGLLIFGILFLAVGLTLIILSYMKKQKMPPS